MTATVEWKAAISRQEDVARLVRALTLDEGFAVYVVLTPSPEVSAAMLEVVEQTLRASVRQDWRWVSLDPYLLREHAETPWTDDGLDDLLLVPLIEHRSKGARAPDAVVINLSRAPEGDDGAWGRFFSRLNRARNTVMLRLGRPLVMVMPARLERILSAVAPDVWSGVSASMAVTAPTRAVNPRAMEMLGRMPEILPAELFEAFPKDDTTRAAGVPQERLPLRLGGVSIEELLREAREAGRTETLREALKDAPAGDPVAINALAVRLREAALDAETRAQVSFAIDLHQIVADVLCARGDATAALHDRALHLNRAGDLLREQGDAGGALTRYREAFEIRLRLYDADPSEERFRGVARSAHRIAQVLHGLRREDEALQTLGEVLARFRRQAGAFVAPALRHDAVLLILRAGVLGMIHGRTVDAVPLLEEARRQVDALIQQAPYLSEYRLDYALTRVGLAVLADLSGRKDEAERWWWEAREEVEAIESQRPGDVSVDRVIAVCRMRESAEAWV